MHALNILGDECGQFSLYVQYKARPASRSRSKRFISQEIKGKLYGKSPHEKVKIKSY